MTQCSPFEIIYRTVVFSRLAPYVILLDVANIQRFCPLISMSVPWRWVAPKATSKVCFIAFVEDGAAVFFDKFMDESNPLSLNFRLLKRRRRFHNIYLPSGKDAGDIAILQTSALLWSHPQVDRVGVVTDDLNETVALEMLFPSSFLQCYTTDRCSTLLDPLSDHSD
jgi:hypothetical protein